MTSGGGSERQEEENPSVTGVALGFCASMVFRRFTFVDTLQFSALREAVGLTLQPALEARSRG